MEAAVDAAAALPESHIRHPWTSANAHAAIGLPANLICNYCDC